MRLRVPNRKVREEFLLIYELSGAQRAIDYLSKHYEVKRMKIVLNGKKLGRNCEAFYFEGKAYFSKRSLKKKYVLHEFFHHLASVKGLELSEREEEKEANNYAKNFLNQTR